MAEQEEPTEQQPTAPAPEPTVVRTREPSRLGRYAVVGVAGLVIGGLLGGGTVAVASAFWHHGDHRGHHQQRGPAKGDFHRGDFQRSPHQERPGR